MNKDFVELFIIINLSIACSLMFYITSSHYLVLVYYTELLLFSYLEFNYSFSYILTKQMAIRKIRNDSKY